MLWSVGDDTKSCVFCDNLVLQQLYCGGVTDTYITDVIGFVNLGSKCKFFSKVFVL
jgi:hypothetical protein